MISNRFTLFLHLFLLYYIVKYKYKSCSINCYFFLTYPSLSSTGTEHSALGAPQFELPIVEITSRKCFTSSTCFSVQKCLYSSLVYTSLLGCRADLELTRLPSDCIVFEMRVSVRVVCAS